MNNLAFGLASDIPALADTVTKTVIAVLSLVAVGMIVVGLVRAVAGRHRVQVVIEDIKAEEGIATSIVAGLSPLLRQSVRQALNTQTLDASYAHLKTLAQDKQEGLLVTTRGTTISAVSTELRATAYDSLVALSAGVRALAPKEAEGFLAMLTASLPDQRGYSVKAFPIVRETATTTSAGLTLEFAEFGHAPDAIATFWSSGSAAATDDERTAVNHAALGELLEPASQWIATRLVARHLAQTPGANFLFDVRRRRSRELLGLRLQLAGQMSLYAIRKHDNFATVFATQALEDLSEASRMLPQYYRPYSTLAAVHERVGWTCREAQKVEPARKAFIRAVHAYDRADELLVQLPASADPPRKQARQRIDARRVKCRLLSGDPAQIAVAKGELEHPLEPQADDSLALYNAACMLAVALELGAADSARAALWEWQAWRLLGRSLLIGGDENGPWELILTDRELQYLPLDRRRRFVDDLRAIRGGSAGVTDTEARALVERVLHPETCGRPEASLSDFIDPYRDYPVNTNDTDGPPGTFPGKGSP